jgi:hypothetical protein
MERLTAMMQELVCILLDVQVTLLICSGAIYTVLFAAHLFALYGPEQLAITWAVYWALPTFFTQVSTVAAVLFVAGLALRIRERFGNSERLLS